jgi:hypothetical protein
MVLLLALLLFFAVMLWNARRLQVEVSPAGVRVRGEYGRMVPARSLLLADARPADLTRELGLRLHVRDNGVGLPGYSVGWFTTRSRERVLAFVTDPRRVAYLPTRDGYALLLSVAEPERFVARVRELAGSPAR